MTRSRFDTMRNDFDGCDSEGTRPPDRVGESSLTADWSLPQNPHELRRVRNRLIALALAIPIVELLRLLFR
jgi:hypothetical protein